MSELNDILKGVEEKDFDPKNSFDWTEVNKGSSLTERMSLYLKKKGISEEEVKTFINKAKHEFDRVGLFYNGKGFFPNGMSAFPRIKFFFETHNLNMDDLYFIAKRYNPEMNFESPMPTLKDSGPSQLEYPMPDFLGKDEKKGGILELLDMKQQNKMEFSIPEEKNSSEKDDSQVEGDAKQSLKSFLKSKERQQEYKKAIKALDEESKSVAELFTKMAEKGSGR